MPEQRSRQDALTTRNRKMRQSLWLSLACLSVGLCASGCGSLLKNGMRTVFIEPHRFSASRDLHQTRKLHRQLARQAWQDLEPQLPQAAASPDYGDGFCEGFADFLDYGGNGLPPVLPPREYWQVDERAPDGQQAAQLWLRGFADGSAAARRSGLRVATSVPHSTCGLPMLGQGAAKSLMPGDSSFPTQLPDASVELPGEVWDPASLGLGASQPEPVPAPLPVPGGTVRSEEEQ